MRFIGHSATLFPVFLLLLLLLSPQISHAKKPDTSSPSADSPMMADNFHWTDPFGHRSLRKFDKACTATKCFSANEYYLHDLREPGPFGLLSYHDAARAIFHARHYPGTWAGDEPALYNRHLLTMDYDTLPLLVRRWIEEQERTRGPGRDIFYVFAKPKTDQERIKDRLPVPRTPEEAEKDRLNDDGDKIVIFAPGAMYHVLPLWVAEANSDCQGAFSNLELYTDRAEDGKVIAWITQHTAARRGLDERNIEFVIQAHLMRAKKTTSDARGSKDEL